MTPIKDNIITEYIIQGLRQLHQLSDENKTTILKYLEILDDNYNIKNNFKYAELYTRLLLINVVQKIANIKMSDDVKNNDITCPYISDNLKYFINIGIKKSNNGIFFPIYQTNLSVTQSLRSIAGSNFEKNIEFYLKKYKILYSTRIFISNQKKNSGLFPSSVKVF